MEDSIFTKIIRGEIPCHKVYEDDKVLAFLDIHPAVSGHTLVIPKKQVNPLWSLADEDYQAVMAVCKMLAQRLKNVLNTQYVGMRVVGEEVPHAHVHLIPFNTISEYTARADSKAEPDHQALAEMAKKLAT